MIFKGSEVKCTVTSIILEKMFWPLVSATAREQQLDWCAEAYNCEAMILVPA